MFYNYSDKQSINRKLQPTCEYQRKEGLLAKALNKEQGHLYSCFATKKNNFVHQAYCFQTFNQLYSIL